MLPISNSACDVLMRIFTPNARDCISLSELRTLVENIDTFYMSEEKIATSSRHVKNTWRVCKPGHRVLEIESPKVLVEKGGRETVTDSLWDDSDDSNERQGGLETGVLRQMEEGAVRRLREHVSVRILRDDETTEESVEVQVEEANHDSPLQLPTVDYTFSDTPESSDILVTPENRGQDAPQIMGLQSDANISELVLAPINIPRKRSRRKSAVSMLGAILTMNFRARSRNIHRGRT